MSYLGFVVKPLFIILLSVVCVQTLSLRPRSQSRRDMRRSRSSLAILDSNKERDGLRGPVHRIRTEVAKVDFKMSPPAEGRRSLLEVTVYDLSGKRVINETYPAVVNSTLGQETYEYDEQGHLRGTIVRNQRGLILSRSVYAYEFDPVGNWVKMTTSVVVGEPGRERLEPVEVTYRTITYYPEAGAGLPAAEGRRAVGAQHRISENSVHLVESVMGSLKAAPTPNSPAGPSVASAAPTGTSPQRPAAAASASSEADQLTDVGPINDKALSLPGPAYPINWRKTSTPIIMTVEVVIDETGRILSARAIEGPSELRQVAEAAARRAVFLPFRAAGRPFKAKGLLRYSFPFTPR